MRVLLFIDSRFRDAFGISLLAHTLKQMGHQVTVAPFDLHQEAIQLLKPDVVVLNHIIGQRNRKIANYVRRQGGSVVVMPTEGRPNTAAQEDWFVEHNDNPDYLDLFLSWNEPIAEKFSRVPTKVVGCPRFDIYQHPFTQLIESGDFFRYRYRLNDRPIIAFASSFPQSKFAYKQVDFNVQDWKDLGIKRDAVQVANEEYGKLRWFKSLITTTVGYYGDRYQYVVKPHPMEDISLWLRFADEWGVTLITNDYIFNVVSNVDLLVARTGCLTHQDAWLSYTDSIGVTCEGDELTGATLEASTYMDTVTNAVDLLDRIYEHSQRDDDTPRSGSPKEQFLRKWGFDRIELASVDAALAIDTLGVGELNKADLPRFHALLQQHNIQHSTPRQDNIGHFGKSCPSSVIEEWRSKIQNANLQSV